MAPPAAPASRTLAKEIRRFKIALNSGCPLRCDYCFLDKDSGEVLALADVETAVDMALGSPGAMKKLLIYGGEPFLHYPLLRGTIAYARRRATEGQKDLAISVATSGAILKADQLHFLKNNRVQLAVSIDGDSARHDRHRSLKSGAGSFEKIKRGLPTAFDAMSKSHMIALLGAHPRHAGDIDRSFQAVVALGFECVNIEVIHGVRWTSRALSAFDAGLGRLRQQMIGEIARRRFLFLESSYHELLSGRLGGQASLYCPFYRHLEIFPNGDYSFYPFPFISGHRELRLARVGNVRDGFIPRYRDCEFDPHAPLCMNCRPEYYRLRRLEQGNAAYALRASHSKRLAAELQERFKDTTLLADYIREVASRAHLGFSE